MLYNQTYYIDHPFTNGAPISLHPVRIEEPFHKHAHAFYEISYIAEGRGVLSFSAETLPVSKGDLIFIPYGKEHLFLSQNQDGSPPLEIMNCLFDEQILRTAEGTSHSRIHDDFEQLTCTFRECPGYIRVRENEKEFARIMHAIQLEQKCKSTGFRYKLYLRLMDLLNHISQAAQQPAQVSEKSLSDPVQYAIDHITTHYKHPASAEEICRQFMISSRHFQRKFKEYTNTTYIKMLQDIRIHRSCELLLDTDWSVQAIAYEVGIQDMKHFYRLFKERCGVTPYEFRSNSNKG